MAAVVSGAVTSTFPSKKPPFEMTSLLGSSSKKLLELLRCRLKLLRSKRYSIVRQLREDIAQLLKIAQNQTAFNRVEQLFKDQNLLDAYDLLDHFTEFIILRFSYIRKNKNRPNDINEAVSTLIFASAWCGDLPELQLIKKLFIEHYGQKFVRAAAELHSGNLVNNEMREKLCIKSVPDCAKLRLINEIAQNYCLQLWGDSGSIPHLLQLCGSSRGHQLEGFVFKGNGCDTYNSKSRPMMVTSHANFMPSILTPMKVIVEQPHLSPMHEREIQIEDTGLESSGSNRLSGASPSKLVVFEEVEELRMNVLGDQHDEDKRVFLFNSYINHSAKDSCKVSGSELPASSHYGVRRKRKSRAGIASSKEKAEKVPSTRCSRTNKIPPKRFEGMASESTSSQVQYSKGSTASSCSHVHPKLPDYDELEAKFKALKKEYLKRTGPNRL